MKIRKLKIRKTTRMTVTGDTSDNLSRKKIAELINAIEDLEVRLKRAEIKLSYIKFPSFERERALNSLVDAVIKK